MLMGWDGLGGILPMVEKHPKPHMVDILKLANEKQLPPEV